MTRPIRIGRLAGIPFGIQPLWLVVAALLTWSLGAAYYPEEVDGISGPASYALGAASTLLLFASVVAHELGHAIVARRHGLQVTEIDLWMLGGVARIEGMPRRPQDELRFALAGPAVSAAVAAGFAVVALALDAWVDGVPALRALVFYQATVNALILGFNLLPAFPLDGGRVARALLWRGTGDRDRATRLAAAGGRAFGAFFVVLGVLGFVSGVPGLIWLGVIGMFLLAAAGSEERAAELDEAFAGHTAGELMSAPAVCVPASATLAEAVVRRFEPYGYTAFPVVDAHGDAIGLLTIAAVGRVAPGERDAVLAAQVADRDPGLFAARDDLLLDVLARPAFMRTGRAIVRDGARPAGVLSSTDVTRRLRSRRLRATRPGARATPAGQPTSTAAATSAYSAKKSSQTRM